MISEDYRRLNSQLHDANPAYGTSGKLHAGWVGEVSATLKSRDVLDYGCGKRTLESALGFNISNYDPCIEELAVAPRPADIVVCTEVLEHIEPDHLSAVLDDMARLTKRVVYISVSTGPAMKVLADGRNAHLIQQPLEWWMPQLEKRFRFLRQWGIEGGFVFIGQSLQDEETLFFNDIGPTPDLTRVVTKSAYSDEHRCKNINSSMLRGLPTVGVIPPHDRVMMLACYGPSLKKALPEITTQLATGRADLYTVSGAHDFLISNGIVPMAHVESDPRPHKAKLLTKTRSDVCYFLSSACDRAVFEAVQPHETWLYHVTSSTDETNLIARLDTTRRAFTIDGGTNVGMSAIGLGSVLGYRKFSIYGMDCSFEVDDAILYCPKDQPFDVNVKGKIAFHAGFHPNEDQPVYRVWIGDKAFMSSPQMFQGAQDYVAYTRNMRGFRFELHGYGFLRALMQHIDKEKPYASAA